MTFLLCQTVVCCVALFQSMLCPFVLYNRIKLMRMRINSKFSLVRLLKNLLPNDMKETKYTFAC